MPFCVNCGAEIAESMKFCPNCGCAVGTTPAEAAPEPIDFSAPVERRDYSVILVSQGSATKTALRELLEDMLGYTVTEARKLTNGMVMEVARGLTASQAMYIAQAITEYGAQAAIATPAGFVDVQPMYGTSVFNRSGYFTAAVTAALAGLTAMNKAAAFAPVMSGDVYRHIFAPRYRRPAPPPHVRRGSPPPRPAPARRPAPAKPKPPRTPPPRVTRPAPPHPAPRPPKGRGPKGPGGFGPGGFGGRR